MGVMGNARSRVRVGAAIAIALGLLAAFLATAGPGRAAVPATTIWVDPVTVPEGTPPAATKMTFTVNIDHPADVGGYQFTYWTTDGTATAGTDYTGIPAGTPITGTIEQGKTTATVTIDVIADTTYEPDETLTLNIDSSLGKPTATGTITNDDPLPTANIADGPTTNEGNSGTTPFEFTVTLSNPSYQNIDVFYKTEDGTAVSPSDFQPVSTTLSFAPGETSKTIKIDVFGDTVPEPNETFKVVLNSAVNATIGSGIGTGTIVNDDAPPPPVVPVLSMDDVTVSEAAGTASLELRLDQPSTAPVTVNVRTVDGTAKAPADYGAVTTEITFAPGETTKQLPITIVSDGIDETDETFTVEMFNVSGAQAPKPKATVTITDLPVLRINDVLVDEGAGAAVLTVTLSGTKSAQPITVGYRTAEDTYKAATSGADFTAVSGTLTFAAGETTKTISVPIVNDSAPEVDETFSVLLDKPVGARIAKSKGQVTIADNDTAPWSGPPKPPSPPAFKPATPVLPVSNPASTPVTPTKTAPVPKAKTTVRKLQASLLSTRITLVKGRRRAAIQVSLSEPVTARIVMLQGKRKLSSAPFKLLGGKRTVFVFLPAYVTKGKVQLQLLVTTTRGIARTLKTTVTLKPVVTAKSKLKPKPKLVKPKPKQPVTTPL